MMSHITLNFLMNLLSYLHPVVVNMYVLSHGIDTTCAINQNRLTITTFCGSMKSAIEMNDLYGKQI